MSSKQTKIITVSLPKALLEKIDETREFESRSSFIRRAVKSLVADTPRDF